MTQARDAFNAAAQVGLSSFDKRTLDTVILGIKETTDANSSAAGTNTQVQYNDNGDFGASANFTWTSVDDLLTIGGSLKFSATGDAPTTDTGIYSPGADQLAISTNGTGRLFVDASGNVGIGTQSPSTNLELSRAGNNPHGLSLNAIDVTNSPRLFFVSTSTNNAPCLFGNDGNLVIHTGAIPGSSSGSERVRIDSSGNVGIGTSSPEAVVTTQASSSFSTTWNVFTGDGIHLGASGATIANQSYGPGISWSRNGVNTTRVAGICSVQEGADTDLAGLAFFTHGSTDNSQPIVERMRIDDQGNVGIGTTSPGKQLSIRSSSADVGISMGAGGNSFNQDIDFLNSVDNFSGRIRYYPTDGAMSFWTNFNERARIDSSGSLLVGTSSNRSIASVTSSLLQVETTTNFALSLAQNANTNGAAVLSFGKSRGTAAGGTTVVQSGDDLGSILFAGADGTDVQSRAASIVCSVDGTPDANDMPGRLVFSTTADGASSPTERMRIDSSGRFLVNTQTIAFTGTNSWFGVYGDASPSTSFAAQSSAGTVAYINRQTDDGELIAFFQDGTQEGSISVSGTTVLFNGAHLSRWSQLPGGAERIEIMRGSVLSNIDEMCEWGEEDNEQLNRMKVSDVEGDKNVSGVFQSWDNDDDTYTNDFYCAMTGDFVIRIAAGITVERGDLLMSAGDGTAKPQDDDIIRSKTIAKVTSTNVSCTYDDGSYCVPCVLMAC